jgi:hypothetical protein
LAFDYEVTGGSSRGFPIGTVPLKNAAGKKLTAVELTVYKDSVSILSSTYN